MRPTAGRKEGGVKLLDIADQPLGYTAAKKRKKMQGKCGVLELETSEIAIILNISSHF